MAIYQYIALNKAGDLIRGSLEAESEHALYTALKERDLFLQKSQTEKKLFSRVPKARPEELIEFSHQMSFIVQSGLPLIHGLADIHQTIKEPFFRATLGSVIHDLNSGDSLSQSLARYPQVFSPGYIAVVSAGETSGNLVASFRDMGYFLEWILNLKRQIQKALFYPCLVLVILSIALAIFMINVVPSLVSFIHQLNRPIPLATKLLIFINDFIQAWWPYLLVFFVIMIISVVIAMRFEGVRFLWDQYKMRIPKVGGVFRDLALVRFVNYLRILYRAGVQIHQSFAILRNVVGNLYYRQKVDRMREMVMSGESLSEAMERVGGFPPLVERSFRVGERTGSLEPTLEQLGVFLDRQVNNNVSRITALLQPALIIILGLIMLFVIVSVIFPIYSILGEIV